MHSNKQRFIFSIVIALLTIGTGCFGVSNSNAGQDTDKPFSGVVINAKEAEPFQLTATVMEISNKPPRNIVVGEKVIRVTAYKLENKVKQTKLVNQNGLTIKLEEIKLGERVVVQGLKLKDGTIVGTGITVKPKK
jgi:hypothetical protein